MPEIIAQLDTEVTASDGRTYFPNVVAEATTDGRWEAWLEFIPLDHSESLLTDTETSQAFRDGIVRWASTLTDTFIEGAFRRAAVASGGVGRAAATAVNHPEVTAVSAAVDPFALYVEGRTALRLALLPLTRAQLLTVISAYGLNPAQLNLARLSNAQLVTFIVTATEAQIRQGRRSAE